MTCKAGPLLIADIPLKNREQNTLRIEQDSNFMEFMAEIWLHIIALSWSFYSKPRYNRLTATSYISTKNLFPPQCLGHTTSSQKEHISILLFIYFRNILYKFNQRIENNYMRYMRARVKNKPISLIFPTTHDALSVTFISFFKFIFIIILFL